ncbi:hypothetical protein llg_23920 [Luteolibacter sp. LG18]|nr:hypothetical protein llg_23920 [Luteolibacter sp. LG18]
MLVALAGVVLVGVIGVGILKEKEAGGEGWKDPDAAFRGLHAAGTKMEIPVPTSEEAEALVRKVLAMRSADEFQGHVRLRGMSEAEAVEFLTTLPEREGKIRSLLWQGSQNANGLQIEGVVVQFAKEGRPLRMALLTPDGAGHWQLDLASFAWHNDVDWQDFYDGRARVADYRLLVAKDSYYNGGYADEKAWSCYGISHPGSDLVMMAYCPRSGAEDVSLHRILKDKKGSRVTLRLERTGDGNNRQAEIRSVLAEDWVVTDAPFDGSSRLGVPSSGE